MPIISGVKTDAITIGQSATNSQNFQLSANNDGTAKLARGSDGSLGDILTVDSGGKVTVNAVLTNRFTSADQTITASGSLTIAHGLGAIPFHISYLLKCTTAEHGYSIGDLVVYNFAPISSAAVDTCGFSTVVDATNLTIKFNSNATTLILTNKSTGANVATTNASWKLIVKAEA